MRPTVALAFTLRPAPATDRMPECREGFYVVVGGMVVGQVARGLQTTKWRAFSWHTTAFEGWRSRRSAAAALLVRVAQEWR